MQEVKDKKTGKTYWYNRITHATTWKIRGLQRWEAVLLQQQYAELEVVAMHDLQQSVWSPRPPPLDSNSTHSDDATAHTHTHTDTATTAAASDVTGEEQRKKLHLSFLKTFQSDWLTRF